MAFWTHTVAPVGRFVEKEAGNYFEYSANDTGMFPEFAHKVWVGDVVGQGFRFANVKKTVAYLATDEDNNGLVVEKGDIKRNVAYQQQ